MNRKFWGATAVVALVVLPLVLARPRVAEAKVTGLQYSIDGETWLGLNGAVVRAAEAYLGVSWSNQSDADLNLRLVVRILDPEGEEIEYPFEQILVPSEEISNQVFLTLKDGVYSLTATLYEAETMELLDSKTISFTVSVPLPQGVIVGFYYDTYEGWQPLVDITVPLGTMVRVGVAWQNTGDYNTVGHVGLLLTKPDALEAVTAVSGQDVVVAPQGTNMVEFDVLIDQEGAYTLYAVLSGEFA